MIRLFTHVDEPIVGRAGEYVGSPMYGVIPEHALAILAVIALFGGAWVLRRLSPKREWAARWVGSYRRLDLMQRLLLWLVAVSAAIHLGVMVGHEFGIYTALYLIDTVLLGWVCVRLLRGRPWRLWSALVLSGSLLGYAAVGLGGQPPDQIGLADKLVEIAALAITLNPLGTRRWRRALASGAVVLMTVIVAVGAWIGAFTAGADGHHGGAVPTPGMLIPRGEGREPTEGEIEETRLLLEAVQSGIAPYADPAVAAAAGYAVDGMWGTSFHAENAAYKRDGNILDPDRPETLVYAVTANGPVLLGAMFEMPGLRQTGPTPGGPLTMWHAHDHVCFSLTPPALTGLVSPFGGCGFGAITIPMTPEAIHVWTIPGAPEPFGDLDEKWLKGYLAGG